MYLVVTTISGPSVTETETVIQAHSNIEEAKEALKDEKNDILAFNADNDDVSIDVDNTTEFVMINYDKNIAAGIKVMSIKEGESRVFPLRGLWNLFLGISHKKTEKE